MKNFHKTLDAARSALDQIDDRIEIARETANRLPELQAQRTEIVGAAYLSGKIPDVAAVDALILEAQGASSAIAVLSGQRPENVERIKQAERELNAAIEANVFERFKVAVTGYDAALSALRDALIEITASVAASSGYRARSWQAKVEAIRNPASDLLQISMHTGQWTTAGMLGSFSINEAARSRIAEIRAELEA